MATMLTTTLSPEQKTQQQLEADRLWREYKADPTNQELRNRLVERYLPLVKYNGERIWSRLPEGVELDDLVSAGVFGLMDAIDAFDLSRGVKFETYCVPRIRGAMLDELRNQDWFPRSLRRKARRIETATQELEARLGRSPRDAELARHMLLDIQDFYRLVGEVSQSSLLSMDEDLRIGHDGTYSSVREMLSDLEATDAHDHLADKELGEIVADTLTQLDGKERLVLTLYYYEELTLAEIGEVLGVSESRVCQIHGKALQRLRMRVRAKTRENPLPQPAKLRRGRALTRL